MYTFARLAYYFTIAIVVLAAEDEQTPVQTPLPRHRSIGCSSDEWTGGIYKCGQLEVPLDYSNPSAGSITLNYTVLPAKDDTPRKGTVFLHLAHEYLGRYSHAESAMTTTFSGRKQLYDVLPGYDLVIWTPRDSAITQRTRCFIASDDEESYEYSRNPYARFENATVSFYNTTFREDLQREPPWDADMAWIETQGPDDVRAMLRAQEKMVVQCLETSPDRDIFKYGGTAASARDLLALADVLDGSASAINLWTKHHGSVLASHVLKMFPGRAGRIIMDDPVDPIAYQEEAGHKRWSLDIATANNTLALIKQRGLRNGSTGFMEFFERPEANDIRVGEVVFLLHSELVEWHTRSEAEYQQVLHVKHMDMMMDTSDRDLVALTFGGTRQSSGVNGWRSYGSAWTVRPLDGMPLVCGDALQDPDTAMDAKRAEVEATLIDNMHGAPLVATSAFPPLRYLCHLWPVRAVERVSLRGADELALNDKVLILLHDKDYWNYFSVDKDAARKRWPAASIADGLQYGDLAFDHDQCSLDVVSTFFDNDRLLLNGSRPCKYETE